MTPPARPAQILPDGVIALVLDPAQILPAPATPQGPAPRTPPTMQIFVTIPYSGVITVDVESFDMLVDNLRLQ